MKKQLTKLCVFVLSFMLVFSVFAVKDIGKVGAQNFEPKALTQTEALENAQDLNIEIADEGMTLIKNEIISGTTRALPFAGSPDWFGNPGRLNVSVFGKNSTNNVFGGSGSSGGSGTGYYDIYQSLDDGGYNVNPALKEFYEDPDRSGTGRPSSPAMGSVNKGFATGETDIDDLIDASIDYSGHKDAAIIFISRIGGEGYDLPTTSIATAGRTNDPTEHYLELDDNEKGLIEHVTAQGFTRVIVLINASQPMELDFIKDDSRIHAALLIGSTGANGMKSVGRILNGTVNPSGRTNAIYSKDFLKDPALQNFSFNANNAAGMDEDNYGAKTGGGWGQPTEYTAPQGNQHRTGSVFHEAFEVSYEEGIYVGYRYYETRGFVEDEGEEDYEWYDANVVYPMGYGLSYTSFAWEIVSANPAKGSALAKDGTISVDVKVTNTGSRAGKDVVQLYYNAPYTEDGIEKSHVVLGAFAKTPLLGAGKSAVVNLSLKVKEMASYDYLGLSGHEGYVLEKGAYNIFIGKNSNDAWRNATAASTINYTVGSQINYTDNNDGTYKVENQFDDVSDLIGDNVMSRADFEATFPTPPLASELDMTAAEVAALNPTINAAYDAGKPWYTATMPTQRQTALTGAEEDIILLFEMAGLDYDDPKWDAFMNQFTVSQLATMIGDSAYVIHGIDALGIPNLSVPDGPTGFTRPFLGAPAIMGETMFYCSPFLVASTWNVELAQRQGEAIGEEGIHNGMTGIYAPAMNTYRTPFSGRNFEYYSEDGLLAGKIAAGVVKGLQSKGVIPYIKHFALNDQETNRDTNGLITIADEQTIREIYLKPFQYAVEEGGALGVMSAFNRIGHTWAGASYALLTEVLRNEWGFQGNVITDFGGSPYMNSNAMIRAGNDYYLGMGGSAPSTATNDLTPTHVAAMRKSVKNLMFSVVHSNGIADYKGGSNLLAYVGQQFSANFSSQVVNPDTRELSYVVRGDLPAGVVFDARSATLKGVAAEAGVFELTIDVVSEGIVIGRNSVVLTVAGVSYEGGTLVSATVGEHYSATVATATSLAGDAASYSLKAGSSLPAGLTMGTNGVIVGKPTTAGNFTFTVVAVAHGTEAVEATFTLVVAEAPAEPEPDPEPDPTPTTDSCGTITDDGAGMMGLTILLAAGAVLFLNKKKAFAK